MIIDPKFEVDRLAQLTPGDLFLFHLHSGGGCVGFIAQDPTENDQKLLVALGPNFPASTKTPRLMRLPNATGIVFRKKFVLRLPTTVDGWVYSEPPPEKTCILKTTGEAYFRVNFGDDEGFRACYVAISTGTIHASGTGVLRPMVCLPVLVRSQ